MSATNGLANDTVDEPKSMKILFTLLSGSLNLKTKEFVGEELDKNTRQLTNGLLHYRPHNRLADSLAELKKKESTSVLPAELLAKTSQLLDLSATDCIDLFNSYLLFEFRGSPESVKQLFTNEKQSKQLLNDLFDYYYSERLFSLFCLKQILSHWKSSSVHVYQQIFLSFLETINDNNQLYPKLFQQLVHLNETPVPSKLSNGPYFTDALAKEWLKNNVKEQTEVLQLLLLYYKGFETSVDNIVELLTLFERNSFGLNYSHFTHNDCDFIGSDEIFKFIGFLQSMIIVEGIDLKWLAECQQKDIESQLFKTTNVQLFKKLDSKITNMNSLVVEHSPIFLMWMIVRSWVTTDTDLNETGSQVVSLLGSNAVQLNVFNYLEKCLSLSQTIQLKGTVVLDLLYQTIGDLLHLLFNVFDIEMLGQSVPALNHLCIKLFKNDNIAKDLYENGLDSGLGLIISSALLNFPFKTNPVLCFCLSLSETANCKKIYEYLMILSNLRSYTEPFDTSLTNYVPTETDSIYSLIRDKMLYRNTELIIKKNTNGLLKMVSNKRVIEWQEVNIDGWTLIYHRFRQHYELISRGQLHQISESAFIELSEITTICSNLIANNCYQHIPSFNRIIIICLETYDLLSANETPNRLLMAAIIELSSTLIKYKYTSDVINLWQRITRKSFMPYMIGLTSDLKDIMMGSDTNTSLLGQLIATEERIKGHYELCIAFLKLFAELIKIDPIKDDNNLMASLVYIVNEIYPSHYFWNFKQQNDLFKVGRLCYDIFDTILTKIDKNSKLGQVLITALKDGKASQTLLNAIKTGETSVRNVILSAGNDSSLVDDDQIVIIRRSLSVLTSLLVLSVDTNASTTTIITTTSQVSNVIESSLFSTQSQPNMLFVISQYVLQRYDPHLATLAVKLLEQLAKCFPMSMLACLGSDAEAMRENFLFRLDQVTEDLNFKIALLNFLSSCVERQPGLMEMFLNVDNKDDNSNTTGCLQTVLEILSEKRDAKYTYPHELHLASLKFLYTFWIGPHLLAIDSLKKTTNVWTLITFPLFENTTVFDDILCVYILKILAREVFYVKTLERDKFDSDLEAKFKLLGDDHRLNDLSKHIHQIFTTTDDDVVVVIDQNSRLLLNAWKEFIISIARFNPFALNNESKIQLIDDIIDCLLHQIQRPTIDNKIIGIFAELLLLLLNKWSETCIKSKDDLFEKFEDLLKSVDESKENLTFNVLNSIEISVIQFLKLYPNELNSCDWTSYSCKLLNQCLRIIEKQIKSPVNRLETEFKLSMTSISLLQTLIEENSSQVTVWTQTLRGHFVLESLANLLIYLIENRMGVELAAHIMSFFIELSSIQTSAETLYLIGFIENLCLSLQNTYMTTSENVTKKCKFNLNINWINVFHLSLQLMTNLVNQLKHHFIDIVITFIAIHLDHILETLIRVATSPKSQDIYESIKIVTLCHSVSRYHKLWQTNHLLSFNKIREQILKTSNSVIAFLIRPNLLSYIMENPNTSAAKIVASNMTPKKGLTTTQTIDGKPLHTLDHEFRLQSVDAKLVDLFFTFQAFSLAFLQNISPNILELMERQGYDGNQWTLLLNSSFSVPNIDPNLTLSFGSLINCIHMCIKSITRSEKTSESERVKQSSQTTTSDLLPLIFETTLSFMVSQTIVAQLSATVPDVEKQKIVREIKSELSTILSSVGGGRQKRISQSFTGSSSSPKSPTTTLIERSFVKFLLQFVEKISQ
ncbi:nucleoporin NUP188-like [Oppia nitens]|uniref:nucleoporin NUP188-like n=1 Tax=Oppia nitens TaxID=1686743 RepID=UPI0023DB07A1|nr:nucleoporin NUP188-like [Oppia nitens]